MPRSPSSSLRTHSHGPWHTRVPGAGSSDSALRLRSNRVEHHTMLTIKIDDAQVETVCTSWRPAMSLWGNRCLTKRARFVILIRCTTAKLPPCFM